MFSDSELYLNAKDLGLLIDDRMTDVTIFEQAPLQNLARDGEIFTFKHEGFWKPMDTLRDKQELQKLWDTNKAPWKTW